MKKWLVRSGWMAAGIAALYVVSALAGAALGGPMDPPGPPGSTYRSLEIIPPSWALLRDSSNGDIDGCNSTRFACVMSGEAVLDGETGLVWQRDAATTSATWAEAVHDCYTALIGGRYGWRLPTWPELMSLSSSTVSFTSPSPFTNVGPGGPGQSYYWSATADPYSSTSAYIIAWGFGGGAALKSGAVGAVGRSICVRAGESIATD